jgi:hypothetical protein
MRKLFNLIPFRRRQMESELDRELAYHRDRRAGELIDQGLTEAEARRQAAIEFGGTMQIQEDVRETWSWRWLRDALQDLRHAMRGFAASPGFAAAAVLSLALGIGANTAIFTLIDAVLLKSLPVKDPQELVLLRWAVPLGREAAGRRRLDGNSWYENGRHVSTSFSYPAYRDIRERGTGAGRPLAGIVGFAGFGSVNVMTGGEASQAFAQLVSGDYFSVLGVRPAVGRAFVAEDDHPGAAPVCLLSDTYWRRRFGGDASIIGKTIRSTAGP